MRCSKAVEAAISSTSGHSFSIDYIRETGGGCINQAWVIEGNGNRFFIKTNSSRHGDMFAAEAEGLIELESANALRVPHPIAHGEDQGEAFLALEYLDLNGPANLQEMGRRLAKQHRVTADQFGWKRNNTIGSTLQINTWTEDWVEFLRKYRFGFQLKLAEENSLDSKLIELGEKLLCRLQFYFQGYQPVPSLLHGDLWSGNAAFTRTGEPVIFDPAVYYGDRESDLAMTELFGGFNAGFYAAYREAWPLDAGYQTRKMLYNLYHVLNHANLFGGGYVSQAEAMIRSLLAETG